MHSGKICKISNIESMQTESQETLKDQRGLLTLTCLSPLLRSWPGSIVRMPRRLTRWDLTRKLCLWESLDNGKCMISQLTLVSA